MWKECSTLVQASENMTPKKGESLACSVTVNCCKVEAPIDIMKKITANAINQHIYIKHL